MRENEELVNVVMKGKQHGTPTPRPPALLGTQCAVTHLTHPPDWPPPVDGVINVISYDLASKLKDALAKRNFQIIIADESHFLKVQPMWLRYRVCERARDR